MTTAIDVFGLTISEPVTSVTDWLVTAVAWWLAVRLLRTRDGCRRLTVPWAVGFWLIGFAALVGGISHAFATYLGDDAYFWIWKATIYSIALSVTCALAGSISSTLSGVLARRSFHLMNISVFAAYAIWMLSHSAFGYVVMHYVPVMLTIALLHAWACTRSCRPVISRMVSASGSSNSRSSTAIAWKLYP